MSVQPQQQQPTSSETSSSNPKNRKEIKLFSDITPVIQLSHCSKQLDRLFKDYSLTNFIKKLKQPKTIPLVISNNEWKIQPQQPSNIPTHVKHFNVKTFQRFLTNQQKQTKTQPGQYVNNNHHPNFDKITQHKLKILKKTNNIYNSLIPGVGSYYPNYKSIYKKTFYADFSKSVPRKVAQTQILPTVNLESKQNNSFHKKEKDKIESYSKTKVTFHPTTEDKSNINTNNNNNNNANNNNNHHTQYFTLSTHHDVTLTRNNATSICYTNGRNSSSNCITSSQKLTKSIRNQMHNSISEVSFNKIKNKPKCKRICGKLIKSKSMKIYEEHLKTLNKMKLSEENTEKPCVGFYNPKYEYFNKHFPHINFNPKQQYKNTSSNKKFLIRKLWNSNGNISCEYQLVKLNNAL